MSGVPDARWQVFATVDADEDMTGAELEEAVRAAVAGARQVHAIRIGWAVSGDDGERRLTGPSPEWLWRVLALLGAGPSPRRPLRPRRPPGRGPVA